MIKKKTPFQTGFPSAEELSCKEVTGSTRRRVVFLSNGQKIHQEETSGNVKQKYRKDIIT